MQQLQEDINELNDRIKELNTIQQQVRYSFNLDDYTKGKFIGMIDDEIKGTIETIQDKEGRL